MKPKWLIGMTCFGEYDINPKLMAEYVQKAGCEAALFDYVPFEHDKSQKLGLDRGNDCVIAYGSIQMIKLVQRSTAWVPAAWCEWDKLKCSYYLAYWGKYSIHHNYAFLPLGEILRLYREDRNSGVNLDGAIFYKYGTSGFSGIRKIFLKSDSNDKAISGEIISYDLFDDWWKSASCYDPELYTMCLISQPQKINKEWRLVIADGKVIAGSQYRKRIGKDLSSEIEAGYPKDAADFAEMVHTSSAEFNPGDIYCMDVGEIDSGEMKMIEIGSPNCAGLYACDIPVIVDAMNEIAIRDWDALK